MSVGVSSTDNARPRDAAADAGWPGHTGLHVARLPGQEHCGTQGRWTNSSGRRGGDVEVTPRSCGFLKNGVKSTGGRQAQTRLPSVFKFVTSENKTIVFVHLLRLRKARTSPERGSGVATGRGVGRGGEPRLLPSSAVPELARDPRAAAVTHLPPGPERGSGVPTPAFWEDRALSRPAPGAASSGNVLPRPLHPSLHPAPQLSARALQGFWVTWAGRGVVRPPSPRAMGRAPGSMVGTCVCPVARTRGERSSARRSSPEALGCPEVSQGWGRSEPRTGASAGRETS